jgi:hypothetical protein
VPGWSRCTAHLIVYLIENRHSPTFAATVAGLFGLPALLPSPTNIQQGKARNPCRAINVSF